MTYENKEDAIEAAATLTTRTGYIHSVVPVYGFCLFSFLKVIGYKVVRSN